MSDPRDRQLLRLGQLVQLEQKARAAESTAELGFVMVNETHGLVPYRLAALWRSYGRTGGRRGRVIALSGLAAIDAHAPLVGWLKALCGALSADPSNATRPVAPSTLPDTVTRDWETFAPAHLLWLPLTQNGVRLGAILLARDTPWSDGERTVLDIIGGAYAHAWAARLFGRTVRPAGGHRWIGRLFAAGAIAGTVTLGFLPISDSALAPAEIIPRDPTIVRAPLDGVVDRMAVRPNQPVTAGALLFTLDPRRLQTQLEVARRSAEVAEAELRQAVQQAVTDPRMRAQIAVLQGRLDQQTAEVAYVRDLLARVEIRALQDGIAVFDDPNDWIGRPVALGERILLVADPSRVEIEIRLPVADAIELREGAAVRLFLNIDPQAPIDASLTEHGYRAQAGPDGTLAYRLKARLDDEREPLRLGLKGTAKLYGREVPLAYYVFRRPLAVLRRWSGL